MMRRSGSVLLLALSLAGCYRYVPSRLSEVGPEQDVRIRVAEDEASRLADFTRDGGRVVDGRVVEQGPDSLLVRVESRGELRGARLQMLYQRVNVSRPAVLEIERRELDKGRTYLLTGAGVVAIAAVAAAGIAGGGSDTPPDGGGPQESVVPSSSLRVPLLGVRFPGSSFARSFFHLFGR